MLLNKVKTPLERKWESTTMKSCGVNADIWQKNASFGMEP